MPDESSSSVKIAYFDAGRVRRALNEWAANLVLQHPEVRRIVLFGSIARGDAVPGSDADLLIVVGESNVPFIERPRIYGLRILPVGADTFVYTSAELHRELESGNRFPRRALSEGVDLYQELAG